MEERRGGRDLLFPGLGAGEKEGERGKVAYLIHWLVVRFIFFSLIRLLWHAFVQVGAREIYDDACAA